MQDMTICPFCRILAQGDLLDANQHAAAFHDAFPLTPGHTLIVPRRCVADYFALQDEEQQSLWRLVNKMHDQLSRTRTPRPTAWTIGINNGPDAGQTIAHCHIHLIPRHPGDHPIPKGGLRQIFPDKAAWWKEEE